jgi:hypothetical protein
MTLSNKAMLTMKSMRFCATILPGFLTFFLSMPLLADSIELADGAVIEGDFSVAA